MVGFGYIKKIDELLLNNIIIDNPEYDSSQL